MPCLVLAYDDSPDARTALEAAGALHPGWQAIVAHVWTPPVAAGAPLPPVPDPNADLDPELELRAAHIAADGARRATRAGLQAEPATRRGGSAGDVAAMVLAIAAEHHAELVVVGRRGLGRVRSAVLGSVSDALVHDAPLPVLVIPSRD